MRSVRGDVDAVHVERQRRVTRRRATWEREGLERRSVAPCFALN